MSLTVMSERSAERGERTAVPWFVGIFGGHDSLGLYLVSHLIGHVYPSDH